MSQTQDKKRVRIFASWFNPKDSSAIGLCMLLWKLIHGVVKEKNSAGEEIEVVKKQASVHDLVQRMLADPMRNIFNPEWRGFRVQKAMRDKDGVVIFDRQTGRPIMQEGWSHEPKITVEVQRRLVNRFEQIVEPYIKRALALPAMRKFLAEGTVRNLDKELNPIMEDVQETRRVLAVGPDGKPLLDAEGHEYTVDEVFTTKRETRRKIQPTDRAYIDATQSIADGIEAIKRFPGCEANFNWADKDSLKVRKAEKPREAIPESVRHEMLLAERFEIADRNRKGKIQRDDALDIAESLIDNQPAATPAALAQSAFAHENALRAMCGLPPLEPPTEQQNNGDANAGNTSEETNEDDDTVELETEEQVLEPQS